MKSSLDTFLKVAESNLKKIEKDYDAGNKNPAYESLSALVDTLEKTGNNLDYCPKLQILKKEALQLMAKFSMNGNRVKIND